MNIGADGVFPTPFRELNCVLSELLRGIRETLTDSFTGLYLQGSIAVGDFDEHSDVDWITVTGSRLKKAQVAGLQDMHHRLFHSGPEWAKHLEGSYFPLNLLKDPVTRNGDLWYLDNGADRLVLSDHCNTILVRWILRERGVVLAGPDPSTLMGPISTDVLRKDIRQEILVWG